MESQTSRVVSTYAASAGGVRAKVERGHRGGYAWELSVQMPAWEGEDHRATFQRAIDALVDANLTMTALFGFPATGDAKAA
jgi:hypothetical protein